jgi:hypothetical protein
LLSATVLVKDIPKFISSPVSVIPLPPLGGRLGFGLNVEEEVEDEELIDA